MKLIKQNILLVFLTGITLSAQENYFPLIVIGGGMAGHTAALYGGNARIPTLLLGGSHPGGQLALARSVENFPAHEPVQGAQLMEELEQQVLNFGVDLRYETVTQIELHGNPRFKITTDAYQVYFADALVVATGASARTLQVPGESDFWGKGVSTCAICDGPFAHDKDVVIVGGGDTAIEEALQLIPYARTITFLIRGKEMRASPRMQEKVQQCTQVKFCYDAQVREIVGDAEMTGVKVYHSATESEEMIPAQGLFLAIGHTPQTAFIQEMVMCDQEGYISTKGTRTSCEGIFAAGDVSDKTYRQAVVAAGDGAKAALDAIAYIRGL